MTTSESIQAQRLRITESEKMNYTTEKIMMYNMVDQTIKTRMPDGIKLDRLVYFIQNKTGFSKKLIMAYIDDSIIQNKLIMSDEVVLWSA